MYFLPQPKHFSILSGYFTLSYDSKIRLDSACTQECYFTARLLQQKVQKHCGYRLPIRKGQRLTNTKPEIVLSIDTTLPKEGYEIQIESAKIHLIGGTPAGLFYGLQTFRQILIQCGPCIPCMKILDEPELTNRGFLHDVTRGRIPTLEQLKKLADKISSYKINQLHLYIEHTFLLEGYSEVCVDDTPLTAEDILELDAYCRERYIQLIPAIASFGHFYKVLRTKTYRQLCEIPETVDEPFGFVDRMRHHTLDVSNPESMIFVKKVIDEYLPLFSSRYFNIGADETFDLGKGNSKKLAEEKGASRLYIDFVKELCQHVVSSGKIPMFWGDIICSFPETIRELPSETICLNWGYEADVTETSTKKLAEAGANLYNCPGVSGWDQLVNQFEVSYENIHRMGNYAYQYHAIGLLNTDWGDCGHINHPDFSIIGMIYGAAISWNHDFQSFTEINQQISLLEFTDRSEQIVSVLAEISKNWSITWRNLVDHMEEMTQIKTIPSQEQIRSSLHNLDQIAKKLYQILPSMDTTLRPAIAPYLNAIRGMQLIQITGAVIFTQELPEEFSLPISPSKLAEELELWFLDYKKEWRKVSRESELYRIQNVIRYYAGKLREIE